MLLKFYFLFLFKVNNMNTSKMVNDAEKAIDQTKIKTEEVVNNVKDTLRRTDEKDD